ncbi:MAG: 13E12 repeat family protein, partial [Propionibacteriaceae bacterium]|jgi:hypothetical protein|nr:13E12 repeat family protein [Propionibacteriaceae bacterium]
MFDIMEVAAATRLVASATAPPIDRLRAAAWLRLVAEAAEVQVVADLAHTMGWDRDHLDYEFEPDERGWRMIRMGHDGTPLVDETLPLEVACARQTSVGVATELIRDIVDLDTLFPETWAAVQAHRVQVWQARRVAHTAGVYDLTPAEAQAVDQRVAPLLGRIGVKRVTNLVTAAVLEIAPDKARDEARRCDAARRVDLHTAVVDNGTTYVEACVDTADASQLEASLNRLADVLRHQGDTSDRDHRRATALGILATPLRALALLAPDHAGPALTPALVAAGMPSATVYVHLAEANLAAGEGVARVEQLGPVLVDRLAAIIGAARIRVTPVIRIGGAEPVVDQYEIPQSIRDAVVLRDGWEVFPYSSREARRLDADHTRRLIPRAVWPDHARGVVWPGR